MSRLSVTQSALLVQARTGMTNFTDIRTFLLVVAASARRQLTLDAKAAVEHLVLFDCQQLPINGARTFS